MARYGFTKQYVLLDGSSANSSTRTSNALLIADATALTISSTTGAAVASVVSVDVSSSDGFGSALGTAAAPSADWQRLAGLSGNTSVSLTQAIGERWLRVVRSAADSQTSVVVTTRST
jgi:hypothetical protein